MCRKGAIGFFPHAVYKRATCDPDTCSVLPWAVGPLPGTGQYNCKPRVPFGHPGLLTFAPCRGPRPQRPSLVRAGFALKRPNSRNPVRVPQISAEFTSACARSSNKRDPRPMLNATCEIGVADGKDARRFVEPLQGSWGYSRIPRVARFALTLGWFVSSLWDDGITSGPGCPPRFQFAICYSPFAGWPTGRNDVCFAAVSPAREAPTFMQRYSPSTPVNPPGC